MRLFWFHIALMPLGKVWIQLFSLQLWVNSRADWIFNLDMTTSQEDRKLWFQTCKLLPKLTLCNLLFVRMTWEYIYIYILSSTDRLFRRITSLKCSKKWEILSVGIETWLTLRQLDTSALTKEFFTHIFIYIYSYRFPGCSTHEKRFDWFGLVC